MTKTDATPGTITAGKLREQHLDDGQVLGASVGGNRIHRGWTQVGEWISIKCAYNVSAIYIDSPDHREIEYANLCRHCFHELLADTRP